jgi:hypothetical protein
MDARDVWQRASLHAMANRTGEDYLDETGEDLRQYRVKIVREKVD